MFLFNKEMALERKIRRSLTFVIRATLLLAVVASIFSKNWNVLFVSFLALFLTFLPMMVARNYRIRLPVELELTAVIFIYATLFLGEVRNYYLRFWWWDVLLHTGSGIALGLMGFLILYVLHEKKKVQASPLLIGMFAFCFAVAIGAVWEIAEFGADQLLGTNMQKSGLVDTMWDLIVDSLGALLTATAGYFYIKRGKTIIFDKLVNKFKHHNPEMFK